MFTIAVVDDTLIIVVSDGAGSASRGDVGAELVVQCAVRYISQKVANGEPISQALFRDTVCFVVEQIERQSSADHIVLREYSSTFLAVVVGKNGGGMAQIGDGVIALRQPCDNWCYAFWPDHGEYVNTTSFITQEDSLAIMHYSDITGYPDAIVVTTDGLERLVLNHLDQTAFSPFYNAIMKPLYDELDGYGHMEGISSYLHGFLQSDAIRNRTDDDTTLVMASYQADENPPH